MVRQSVVILLLLVSAGAARAADARPQSHGGGQPVTVDELPPGRFHDDIARLAPAAQGKALAWLSRMQFHDFDCADLHADAAGGIFFACANTVPAPAPVAAALPPIARASVPIANQPSYHSRPGATNRIYLDFNGMTISGTAWGPTMVGRPYDLDGDETTFNDAEQASIHHVWERVAEDYSPFNVDVTTDPAVESAMTNTTAHVLITNSASGNANPLPSNSAGGVAYVGVFGDPDYVTAHSPAFIYFNNLGGGREDYVAEACAHETGHNVGLSHDGTNAGGAGSYYGGHGSGATSWGPIMGASYNRNVTQFCKGEYFDANQTQDDLSIISGFLTRRTDDYGNTDAAATMLTGPTLSASGIIEAASDVDVVGFATGAGSITLSVSPWQSPVDTAGGNVDVLLQLVNSSGTVIATANDPTTVTASITTAVAAGVYYLHISGTGVGTPLANPPSGYTSYGSVGQWFLTGTVNADTIAPTASASLAPVAAPGGTTYQFTVTYADDAAISVASIDSDDVQVSGPSGYAATASLVSINLPGDGTPRTATYQITPPGGAWDYQDNGSYTVSMKATAVVDTSSNAVAAGSLGSFNVGCPIPPGPGTGILREWFDGIPGSAVTDLTSAAAYPAVPTGDAIDTSFEAPTNRADDYGTRMRAYFIAPVSGAYTFVIASDATSELWLSSDTSATHAVKIAWVSTFTSPRQWTKEANQTSSPIALVRDRRYYVEARHKAAIGNDNLAVGVVLPGGIVEEPIGGDRLAPVHRPGEDGGSPKCGVGGLGALLAINLLALALASRRRR